MTGLGEQRLARAALAYLAEPADPALGALLAICEPAEILAAIKADLLPATRARLRRHHGKQDGAGACAGPLASPATRAARR